MHTLRRSLPLPSARVVALYAAIAMAMTGLFFFLHYLGNQTPYDLARQRVVAEYAAHEIGKPGRYFMDERPLFIWEFCQVAQTTIAGAHHDAAYNPLTDAVLIKSFERVVTPDGSHCHELGLAAVDGAVLPKVVEQSRYWWGGKALFAIGLRWLTIFEIHRLILYATYAAWLSLAVALALFGWRALLIGSPFIAMGAAFSHIAYFADITNGLPYLLAVLSTAGLGLLLRWDVSAHWARLFCFIAGMASAYLWLSDGHNALAIALIGVVAWLGYGRVKSEGAIRRAAVCVALYIGGFAACFALGQATKIAVCELSPGCSAAAGNVAEGASTRGGQATEELLAGLSGGRVGNCAGCGDAGWHNFPIVSDVRGMWAITPISKRADALLAAYSALALVGAVALALRQARRGRLRPGKAMLWLAALTALASTQFLMPNDLYFRNERFAFILLAVCWSCAAIALTEVKGRLAAIGAVGVVGAVVVSLAVVERGEGRRLDRAIAGAEVTGAARTIDGEIGIHRDKDDGRLLYVTDRCLYSTTVNPFFLHIIPESAADLPVARRQLGFENRDFLFVQHRDVLGGRCAATLRLPDYPIAAIFTGEKSKADAIPAWSLTMLARHSRHQAALGAIRAGEFGAPIARYDFNIYHRDNAVIYHKPWCADNDMEAKLFLHVAPEDTEDLPASHRQAGIANLDFVFAERGANLAGGCVAIAPLPEYPIKSVSTGEKSKAGADPVWSLTMLAEPERHQAALRAIRAGEFGAPVAQATFEIYHRDNAVIYHKSECAGDDMDAKFLLHVVPENAADLPASRRQAGFANLDFVFAERGTTLAGGCVVIAPLPSYPIASIRTGQFVSGQPPLWKVEFAPGGDGE